MDINEFEEKVLKGLDNVLDSDVTIHTSLVNKNNGVTLHGLSIHKPGCNISPTIYLESFLEEYEKGATLSTIISDIIKFNDKFSADENIDMSFFQSFDAVKDKLCCKLINMQLNEEMLKDIPWYPYLDLALVFYCHYENVTLGKGAILIHNNHLKMWEVDKDQVLKVALYNTPKLYPYKFEKMSTLLDDMVTNDEMRSALFEAKIWVLTNTSGVNGAVSMMYPGLLKKLGTENKCSFYIIPSSIHELILIPYEGIDEKERFEEMIKEVNSTQLEHCEILSDNLYFYDLEKDEVRVE